MSASLSHIEACLTTLAPEQVELQDDSHRHVGHVGAAGGGGHYTLRIVSGQFEGLGRLARHRLVYAALSSLMQREIHALSIIALTPGEAGTSGSGADRA